MPDLQDIDYIKIITLGDSGVGKTALLKSYLDQGETREKYSTTIGVILETANVPIRKRDMPLRIWDTPGQERFRSVTHQFIRDTAGVLLVYDVSQRSSFDSLKEWLLEIRTHNESTISVMIVGNKSDLASRVVTTYEGRAFADKFKCMFQETSALNGDNISAVFEEMVSKICIKVEDGLLPTMQHGVKYKHSARNTLLLESATPTLNSRANSCC